MPSTTTLWQALADALDDRETVTLSGGSTTTAVSLALVNADAGVTSNLYAGRWFFNQTKVTQAKVASYDKAAGTVTNAPAVTANASTDVGHFTHLFPVRHTIGAETDYLTLCNRALGRMMLEVEVEVTITTSDTYPMTAFPSLDRPERLREVREPSPVAGRAAISSMWRGWELVPDPPTASLRVKAPFGTVTGNIEIEWTRPAATWINNAESAVGLVAESDTAQPSVEEFLPFALTEALPVLIARSPGRPNAEWLTLLAQAEADVKVSRWRDRTQEVAPAAAPPSQAA